MVQWSPIIVWFNTNCPKCNMEKAWDRSGPVFYLLLGVSSGCAQPITGQVTSVTWPVIGWAYSELTLSQRQKMSPDWTINWQPTPMLTSEPLWVCYKLYRNGAIKCHLEGLHDISGTSLALRGRYLLCRTPVLCCFNTLRPGQNGCHFADDLFKCIYL